MGVLLFKPAQVLLEPVQLRLPQLAHALQLHHIDQADEVHALVVEAVPAVAPGALAVALQVQLAVVDGRVVFARHIEHLPLRVRASTCSSVSNSAGFDECVRSPV